MITAFEAAIKRVHDEPGVELYVLHEVPDRPVMIEKYTSEQVRLKHRKAAALADLGSALEGKLNIDLDAQVLVPPPAGTRRRAHCDCPPDRDRGTQRPAPTTPHSHDTASVRATIARLRSPPYSAS